MPSQFAAGSAAATLIIMQALVDSSPNFCVSFATNRVMISPCYYGILC